MAQTNRYNRRTRTNYRQSAYIEGNTARKLDVQRQLKEAPRPKLSQTTQKNREKAHHMSMGYVLFLAVALCISGYVLVNYIQLQSELTNKVKRVAYLESQLNNLKLTNDEDYNRILSNVDLEEIKSIAIGELGMSYATQGQIVNYASAGSEYMRKVADN